MFNKALILQVSKTKTIYEKLKNMLSYSDILTVKNTDIITKLLSGKLFAYYRYYLNKNKLAQPGLLLIQGHIDNNKN